MSTKCAGAWNLHNALENQPVEFFVLASSLASLIEVPGQSNYSAANSFLEAFCQYRHSIGLPASVVSISPIEDVGYIAENADARKSIDVQGMGTLSNKEFLEYMELAILNSNPSITTKDYKMACKDADPLPAWHNPSHIVMGLKSSISVSDAKSHTSWRRDRRMGFYHNIPTSDNLSESEKSQLTELLNDALEEPNILKTSQSIEILAKEIGKRIFALMLKDTEEVNIEMEIRDMGMDSLMAIELRRWWWQTFRVEVSVMDIMGVGKLIELANLAAKGFIERLSREESV